MTGVGKDRSSKLHGADVRVLRVQRPELIVEALPVGSNRSLQSYCCVVLPLMPLHRWVEVPFVYKPTSLYQALPMVAPFQPRLDWQMWFAALSSYERTCLVVFVLFLRVLTMMAGEPWLLVLIHELLQGGSDAWKLLGGRRGEFATVLPRAMRVTLYHYDLTVWGAKNSSAV
jgi:hypothetical protein